MDIISALNDLLDDLTLEQFRHLVDWHWTKSWPVSRASIKSWRRSVGLKVN